MAYGIVHVSLIKGSCSMRVEFIWLIAGISLDRYRLVLRTGGNMLCREAPDGLRRV